MNNIYIPARSKLSSAFSPLDIAGCELWLDANDSATVTVTSSPDVDAWLDKSPAGNDVAQTTSAARKPHTGGAIGTKGLTGIAFDGTDDYLINSVAGGSLSGTSGAVFAVAKIGGALQTATLLGSSSETDGSDYHWCYFPRVQGGGIEREVHQHDVGVTTDAYRTLSDLAISTNYLVAWLSDGSTWTSRLNGAARGLESITGSNTGDWWDDAPGRDNFTVGNAQRNEGAPGAFHWIGVMGEICAYSAMPTVGEVTQLETYLNGKWGMY